MILIRMKTWLALLNLLYNYVVTSSLTYYISQAQINAKTITLQSEYYILHIYNSSGNVVGSVESIINDSHHRHNHTQHHYIHQTSHLQCAQPCHLFPFYNGFH